VTGSIRPFYADWAGYNRRLVEGLAACSPETLALRAPRSDHWPIWAIAGHMAGTRVFWLCEVFGEPGAEGTPFGDDARIGWEDDLTRPRSGAELEHALTSTWDIVDGCLRRWTPETLGESVRRDEPDRPPEFHTRQSILLRMISHEAYHLGEINVALSSNGREPIDPWPGHEWQEGASVHLREG
jgi:uncharacterized damage-inducible protein DinB